MEKFIKALKQDRAYEYISNYYNNYTKEELKNIILELLYGIFTNDTDYMQTYENIVEEIKERYINDEEE